MKQTKPFIFVPYLILALFVWMAGASFAWGANFKDSARESGLAYPTSETEWQRVNPQGEEISILTPGATTLLTGRRDFVLRKDGEKISVHRTYSAYAGDFIFAIDSYKASRPQRILVDLELRVNERLAFDRDVSISGVSGRRFHRTYKDLYEERLSFATKQHVYLITLVARQENSPAIAKFFAGLILGEKISSPATGYVVDMKESDIYRNALRGDIEAVPSQAQVFTPKDVSRKAAIAWRPEPLYTEQARQDLVTGTVVLRAVFNSNGRLTNVRVVKGLKSGLTDQAVEAALSIRFFPAEIDGKPVSQYIQIEYNFNLY